MAAKDSSANLSDGRKLGLLGPGGKSMRSMAHLTGSRLSFTRSTLNVYNPGAKDERSVQPRIEYEPTYKTKPDVKFHAPKVQKIAFDVLQENLKEIAYDKDSCRQLAQTLSTVIKNRVKELNFERYKIVCIVHIGQLSGQAMRVAGRCLWDHETDNYAAAVYETKTLFSVAVVYGIYRE